MLKDWDVRPRCQNGDDTPEEIFLKVGEALNAWENLESALAELFDCLVSGSLSVSTSNRAGFCAFVAVKASSARTELLQAATPRALLRSAYQDQTHEYLDRVRKFGARRNEIAHGRVFNLSEHGFQLGPNNTNLTKFISKGTKKGSAKYQYKSTDIAHYRDQFFNLIQECNDTIKNIYDERSTQYFHLHNNN